MKFIFIIQGEGRGHMTQAISLFRILEKNGHKVCQVVIGKSKRRTLPKFFLYQITAPITQLESPNFVTDKNNKSVKIFRSLFINLWKIRTFISGVNKIHELVLKEQPDTILNFYDFLGGLYFMIKRPSCCHVALAHQFFLAHSSFEFPKGRPLDKTSLLIGNKLAGYRAKKVLGLSFRDVPDEPRKKLFVVPPLLREEIKSQPVSQGDHFLVYMVNDGYSAEVERFHKDNSEIPVHCFWDKKDAPEILKVDETLSFHQLNDKRFIQYMASCRGYLSTAGFESICEAMYLGKPVLMVPVQGHFEQSCNAVDAVKSGAGVSSTTFDLQILLSYLDRYQNVKENFHLWCSQTERRFLENLVPDAN